MTDTEAAYLAGLIDGEGSFNLNYRPKAGHYQLRLEIWNTDQKMIAWISRVTEGGVLFQQARSNRSRICYGWRMYGHKIKPVIDRVLPFLITKRPHALASLEYYTTIGEHGKPLPPDKRLRRTAVFDRFRELNKKGIILHP